jgi:hypothetical protein
LKHELAKRQAPLSFETRVGARDPGRMSGNKNFGDNSGTLPAPKKGQNVGGNSKGGPGSKGSSQPRITDQVDLRPLRDDDWEGTGERATGLRVKKVAATKQKGVDRAKNNTSQPAPKKIGKEKTADSDENQNHDDGVDDVDQEEWDAPDGTVYYSKQAYEEALKILKSKKAGKRSGGAGEEGNASKRRKTHVATAQSTCGDDIENAGEVDDNENENEEDDDLRVVDKDSLCLKNMPTGSDGPLKSLALHWNIIAKHLHAIRNDYEKLARNMGPSDQASPTVKDPQHEQLIK